jgi:hypothetical protein
MFRDNLGIGFVNPEVSSIKTFVEECIKGTGEDAVLFIGQSGGYFLGTASSTSEGVPYYYLNGKNYMPSKESVEKEISLYMDSSLPYCTNEFGDFPDFNVSEGEISTKTEIKEGEVIFSVDYPLTITKGESSSIIKDFKMIKISADVLPVYNAIKEIINEQVKRAGEGICLSCLYETASENKLIVDMTPVEDGVVFVVKDEKQLIKGVGFEWRFANKYENNE